MMSDSLLTYAELVGIQVSSTLRNWYSHEAGSVSLSDVDNCQRTQIEERKARSFMPLDVAARFGG